MDRLYLLAPIIVSEPDPSIVPGSHLTIQKPCICIDCVDGFIIYYYVPVRMANQNTVATKAKVSHMSNFSPLFLWIFYLVHGSNLVA